MGGTTREQSERNAASVGKRFIDLYQAAADRVGSPICIGLDPVLDRLPPDIRAEHWDPVAAIEAFSTGVVDAVADAAPIVKLQSACFERYGAAGVRVLEHVAAHARGRGLLVLLDAKRGDIGISAEHYAHAAAGLHAQAITVNGYLGPSTIEPYLKAGLGVFVLVRTSNPDSDLVQSESLQAGGTIAELMARRVALLGQAWTGQGGLSDVGAVVGATKASDGRALREAMPDQVFLVPGYGAQGGTADDVRALLRPGARTPSASGVMVTASRSVIYASKPGATDWREAIHAAALSFRDEIAALLSA